MAAGSDPDPNNPTAHPRAEHRQAATLLARRCLVNLILGENSRIGMFLTARSKLTWTCAQIDTWTMTTYTHSGLDCKVQGNPTTAVGLSRYSSLRSWFTQMWQGVSPVPAQMWVGRGEPSLGADVGGVRQVPAQIWHGVSAVPAQMWAGDEPSPGVAVSEASPVPVQMLRLCNLRA